MIAAATVADFIYVLIVYISFSVKLKNTFIEVLKSNNSPFPPTHLVTQHFLHPNVTIPITELINIDSISSSPRGSEVEKSQYLPFPIESSQQSSVSSCTSTVQHFTHGALSGIVQNCQTLENEIQQLHQQSSSLNAELEQVQQEKLELLRKVEIFSKFLEHHRGELPKDVLDAMEVIL